MRITWRTSHHPGWNLGWTRRLDKDSIAPLRFQEIHCFHCPGVATRFHVSVWSVSCDWLVAPPPIPARTGVFVSRVWGPPDGQTQTGVRSPRPDRIRSGAFLPPTPRLLHRCRPPRFVRSAPVSASRPCFSYAGGAQIWFLFHIHLVLSLRELIHARSYPGKMRRRSRVATARQRRTRAYPVRIPVLGHRIAVVGWERGARGHGEHIKISAWNGWMDALRVRPASGVGRQPTTSGGTGVNEVQVRRGGSELPAVALAASQRETLLVARH
jgi:hypothetical protein